jgi:Arm DNA-binding domain
MVKPSGRHPHHALNAVKVRSIKKPRRHGDGNGLYPLVDESGAKRWILRTVIHNRRTDIGLGGLSLVSLAEAREEATRLRKIARDGGDPIAERRKARSSAPTCQRPLRAFTRPTRRTGRTRYTPRNGSARSRNTCFRCSVAIASIRWTRRKCCARSPRLGYEALDGGRRAATHRSRAGLGESCGTSQRRQSGA